MTEYIESFFSGVFGDNVILATILISIVPIIELKGAIPFAMSPDIWGASALSSWQAFAFALLGTSLIVFALAGLYIPIINWLKSTKFFRRLGTKLEQRVNRKSDKLATEIEREKDKTKWHLLKIAGVFIFVALPLPFTGVWTGTCIAVALGLGYWASVGTVLVANAVAGVLIVFISSLFGSSTIVFFYIFLGVVVLIALALAVRSIVIKIKVKKTANNGKEMTK
jgi:uncharacterized membrane protein